MASITGAQSKAGIKIASTWGTAVACGAGNSLSAEITPNFNVSEISARQIGSGNYMLNNVTRGSVIPTVSLTADLGYRNNCDVILAQFMGTAAAPSELNLGEGDYLHEIFFNSNLNTKYLTLAFETASANVMEFPTLATTGVTIKSTSIPGYVDFSADMTASGVQLASLVNTNATLANCDYTEGTPELVAVDYSDTYQTNDESDGSVSSGDQYNITGFQLAMKRPQEVTPEIKGSAGNPAPLGTDLFDTTFDVDVRELADHTYYTIWSAETARKASLVITGTQIGAGANKSLSIYLPRMVLVNEPQYALTDKGTNKLALKFRVLKSAVAPSGMSSPYPYFELVNTLSTSLLA